MRKLKPGSKPKDRQINFRASPECKDLLFALAHRLSLSDADTLRLGLFLVQATLHHLVSDPQPSDMRIMRTVTPESAKFRLLLPRSSALPAGLGAQLTDLLDDVYRAEMIHNQEARLALLTNLQRQLENIFAKIK